jgi:putative serine protease PepD
VSEFNRASDNQFSFPVAKQSAPTQTANQPAAVRRGPGWLALVSFTLLAAVFGAAVTAFGGGFLQGARAPGAPVIINDSQQVGWVTGVAATAGPSVVTLAVTDGTNSGSGSGVILNTEGFILTNSHVVTLGGQTSSANVSVRFWDGSVTEAEVVGTDPTYDLAVIRVSQSSPLAPIEFADSSSLNVGDAVAAIGAPLGFSSTITEGIVSALNRTIEVASSAVPEEGGLQLWDGSTSVPPISIQVIQTDAAINPGNSGGALVDSTGRLVGINVAIATAGGGRAGSIGVGFAIPANTAKRIADEIINTGEATHGLLGAMVRNSFSADGAFSLGAEIVELTPSGAAELGGLRVGDVVIEFVGQPIASATELTAAVRAQAAGATVELKVNRGGEIVSLRVTLGNASASA